MVSSAAWKTAVQGARLMLITVVVGAGAGAASAGAKGGGAATAAERGFPILVTLLEAAAGSAGSGLEKATHRVTSGPRTNPKT